jgi:hypothetical protein
MDFNMLTKNGKPSSSGLLRRRGQRPPNALPTAQETAPLIANKERTTTPTYCASSSSTSNVSKSDIPPKIQLGTVVLNIPVFDTLYVLGNQSLASRIAHQVVVDEHLKQAYSKIDDLLKGLQTDLSSIIHTQDGALSLKGIFKKLQDILSSIDPSQQRLNFDSFDLNDANYLIQTTKTFLGQLANYKVQFLEVLFTIALSLEPLDGTKDDPLRKNALSILNTITLNNVHEESMLEKASLPTTSERIAKNVIAPLGATSLLVSAAGFGGSLLNPIIGIPICLASARMATSLIATSDEIISQKDQRTKNDISNIKSEQIKINTVLDSLIFDLSKKVISALETNQAAANHLKKLIDIFCISENNASTDANLSLMKKLDDTLNLLSENQETHLDVKYANDLLNVLLEIAKIIKV